MYSVLGHLKKKKKECIELDSSQLHAFTNSLLKTCVLNTELHRPLELLKINIPELTHDSTGQLLIIKTEPATLNQKINRHSNKDIHIHIRSSITYIYYGNIKH